MREVEADRARVGRHSGMTADAEPSSTGRKQDFMNLQLTDKTALVTGASAGIGRGIALALAAEGARLAIAARRVNLLDEVADAIVTMGGHRPVVMGCGVYADDA